MKKERMVAMSWRKNDAASGYCSLTATSEPSFFSVARCTWPMEADPRGSGSRLEKVSSTGLPVASSVGG